MEEITKRSIIINEIKLAIERDENALEYQVSEFREKQKFLADLTKEMERSKEIIKLEKEILEEYEQ